MGAGPLPCTPSQTSVFQRPSRAIRQRGAVQVAFGHGTVSTLASGLGERYPPRAGRLASRVPDEA